MANFWVCVLRNTGAPRYLAFLYRGPICMVLYENYTRRGFFGLGPLNGTGVISLMELTATPLLMNPRMADSRPDPTPLTTTSISLSPSAVARKASVSPTLAAANGVPFLAPRNPAAPLDPH